MNRAEAPAPRPPNLIVIFCDDLGYGDLGCYGSGDHDTPRLDRMAAEGMRFTDAYVPSPVCTPSRAGLAYRLLPAARRAGSRGGGSAGAVAGRRDRPLCRRGDHRLAAQGAGIRHPTDRYLVDALRFIHDNRDRPFFLYFAHHYVHSPIYVPQNYLRTSRNGPYGAAVAHVDFTVGAILDTLGDLGIGERTLVVFTSDNGAAVAPTPRELAERRRNRRTARSTAGISRRC